ncbi:hypothetical protein B0H17DRAFT_1339674 [Mycena rosella]|uniref:Protein kinase domain-containing protein n=1 Tax=Mycena rosella TaxID=1033263 RepID=A0AAD7FN68_MYCRO|nr:hypothetical protein B0H17DRAFT_1339674 [Mycena rosella]
MATTSTLVYPSAFSNPLATVSSNADERATSESSASSNGYTGQIASFILLVAGLEANLKADLVFFDFSTSFPPPRAAIGSGASFTVERAGWRETAIAGIGQKQGWGSFVALKYIRRAEKRREVANWKQILLEIRALLHEPIRYHPNIVRLLGLYWGAAPGMRSTFPVLVLEYADFGTLTQLQASASPFTFGVKKKLCLDVAKGLAILHACDIVHGDLKHENVLIFTNKVKDAEVPYTAKLADFGGSAMDIQEGADRFLPSGTPSFNAPEAANGLDAEGLKRTDVYSLGLLVWRVVLDGESPFDISPFTGCTPDGIEDLKRFDELLAIAKESVSDRLVPDVAEDEREIMNFVLENTLQVASERRCLIKTTAALSVRHLPEIYGLIASVEQQNEHSQADVSARAPGAHGTTTTSIGLFLAKASHEYDHDYQSAGPGSTPKLPPPDPAQLLFYPERLKATLDWSLQVEIVRDLENAAVAPAATWSTQVSPGLAAFYLFRSYLYEFGVEFDAERACYWLRQAAVSRHECQENYLAQAWCWRIHQALGQPLRVELSVLREWMMLAIFRGHRRCIADSQQIITRLTNKDDKRVWREALCSYTYYFLRVSAGVGMPYFVHSKRRRLYNLNDMDALDRDIQAEFALRAVSSVDQIYVNHRGDGLLHFAASMGNLPALQHLVANYQPNIDLENQAKSETPLLAACRGGHLDCALFFLEQGARPDGSDWGEETPLYWLCSFAAKDASVIARKLVDAGAYLSQHPEKRRHRLHTPSVWADPESLLSLPVSPLSRAVIMQSIPAVSALLSLGADPLEGFDPQLLADKFQCAVIVAAFLTLPRILEILLLYVDTETPVLSAAQMLHIVVGKFVLPAVDPTSLQSRLSRCGTDYRSAMFETLQILHARESTAPAQEGDEFRARARHSIVARMVSLGKFDVVESLLRLGYSVHGSPHACPIVEAVRLNHDPLFRLLVKYGANIHMIITRPDHSQLSLLQVSADTPPQARTGISIPEYLLKMGVPVDPPPDCDGPRSAFAFAVIHQNFALAELLLLNGADIDFAYRLDPRCARITVLGELVRNPTEGNLEAVKYLLGAEARPSAAGPHPLPLRALPSSTVDPTNALSVLHFAAIFPPRTDTEALLLGEMTTCILSDATNRAPVSAALNHLHPDLGTPLWAATLCCNLEVVAALLEGGADARVEFMGVAPREVAAVLLKFEQTRTDGRAKELGQWTAVLDYLRRVPSGRSGE